MVANLDYVNGVASMMYATEQGSPWPGEGTPVTGGVGPKEAARIAGIDWDLYKEPLFTSDGMRVPGSALRRSDTNAPICVVSDSYQILQNSVGVDFLETLTDDAHLDVTSAGALDGGRKVWMQINMGDMRILDDVYAQFLAVSWRHDGYGPFRADAGNTRIVCENTLLAATSRTPEVRITHKGDIEDKLDRARALLRATTGAQRRMQEWLESLTKVEIGEPELVAVRESLFGSLDEATPTQRKGAIDGFLAIYREETERNGENAYSLAQAVTGYADHKVRVKKDQSRLSSILTGTASMFKKDGLNAVAKVANVPILTARS